MTTYPAGTNASLTVQWYEYAGGPPANVTAQTVTIIRISGAVTVVGPTSVGIAQLATGLYSFTWAVPAGEVAGDYVVVWDATDAQLDSVQTSEIFTITGINASTDFGPCAPWEPIWCTQLPTGSEEVSGFALEAATEILWQGTRQRFGVCTTTIRPCRRSCYGSSWPFTNSWWEFGTYPQPVLYAGAWYNITCGSCPDTCSCGPLEQVALPTPARNIIEVKLDGTPMPSGSYRLDDNRFLVRTDGLMWPVCQDLAADDTENNTWSITLQVGEDVPVAGRFAVGELAIDYMKMCLGLACEFPKWATVVNRADVSINFPDFTQVMNAGLTGLPLTDRFLRRYNPHNYEGQPTVYDLDGAPSWRRAGTS